MRDEADRTGILAQLIDGEHTVASEIGLGGGKVGEYETGAIAEDDTLAEMDGLEVLGFTGSRGDGDLLGSDEGVDGGGFTDVGVSDETDLEFVIGGCLSVSWICIQGTKI